MMAMGSRRRDAGPGVVLGIACTSLFDAIQGGIVVEVFPTPEFGFDLETIRNRSATSQESAARTAGSGGREHLQRSADAAQGNSGAEQFRQGDTRDLVRRPEAAGPDHHLGGNDPVAPQDSPGFDSGSGGRGKPAVRGESRGCGRRVRRSGATPPELPLPEPRFLGVEAGDPLFGFERQAPLFRGVK